MLQLLKASLYEFLFRIDLNNQIKQHTSDVS